MAENGENSGGVLHRWELAAEVTASKLAAARRDVEKAKKELENINLIRKRQGKRPLSLEEYLAIKAPAPPPRTSSSFSSYAPKEKVRPPLKFRETYIEFVKAFMKALDTGSEIDVMERSKGVFFHYFSLDEFKSIVDKASGRFMITYLFSLMNKLDKEAEQYIMESNESSKTGAFREYVNDKYKATFLAKKIHEEEVEAAAKAAALKAEADAAEAARVAEEAAAAAAAAAAGAGEKRAQNIYRKIIEEYADAQEKAGRSKNLGAKKRSMNLRAALAKYNKNGTPVNEALLPKKIKKNLTEKGLMKGGRQTRKQRK